MLMPSTDPELPERPSKKLGEFVEEYLDYVKSVKTRKTYVNYRATLLCFTEFAGYSITLDQITPRWKGELGSLCGSCSA